LEKPGELVTREEQHQQHLERLVLKPNPDAVLAQLTGYRIDFEHSEPDASV